MDKLKVYHFHNGNGGGVLSVIKNLVYFSNNPLIENHVIYAINKDEISNYNVENIQGAITQQLFYYTPQNNFYYTCNQLAKLLPDNKALIVAHDWIELGMVSNLGLQNPVVQVLHGDFDYYYELANNNQHIIDAFICISPTIYRKLISQIGIKQKCISYLNFPVPFIEKKSLRNDNLNIIYNVRNLTDHRKQFSIILDIAKELALEKNKYFFTIIGEGYTQETFFEIWPPALKDRVNYLGVLPNQIILDLLPSQDIILLPSLSEGLPVSLIEAMKAGVVPLITNWDGAVDEIIKYGTSGYYLNIGDVEGYVNILKKLQSNSLLLKAISDNCSTKANYYFNPFENTRKFERIFEYIYIDVGRFKKSQKKYGSRLDQTWIPNKLVLAIRKIIKFK